VLNPATPPFNPAAGPFTGYSLLNPALSKPCFFCFSPITPCLFPAALLYC
jgi:hypothetical protein